MSCQNVQIQRSLVLVVISRCEGIREGGVGGRWYWSSILKTRKDLDMQKGLNEEEFRFLAVGWTKCFENPFCQNTEMLGRLC